MSDQQTSGNYAPREIKKPWYITEEILSQRVKNEKRPVSLSKKEKREYKRTQIPPPVLTEDEYLSYLKEQEKYYAEKDRAAAAENKMREKTAGGGAAYWTTIKKEKVTQNDIDEWENRNGGWDNMH